MSQMTLQNAWSSERRHYLVYIDCEGGKKMPSDYCINSSCNSFRTSWKEATGSKVTDGSKWLDPSAYESNAKEDLSYYCISITLTYPMLDWKNNLHSLPVKEEDSCTLTFVSFHFFLRRNENWGTNNKIKKNPNHTQTQREAYTEHIPSTMLIYKISV